MENSADILEEKAVLPAEAKVLLLEDQITTRKILAAVIAATPGLKLVAAFDSVEEGLSWLKHSVPDVLLVDLKLRDGLGLEVIKACAKLYPQCLIMVLTASKDREDVDACIKAGALGYLVKEGGLHTVGQAIRDLILGGSPVSPCIVRTLLVQNRQQDADIRQEAQQHDDIILTSREQAVLRLIAKGLTYEQTAQQLNISVLTVQNYIKRLYRKLSVTSRGQAVFEAQKRGLLT